MEKYLIKKLVAHELGYRKGKPQKAGAYFLLPKDKDALNIFPELKDNILKDTAIINVATHNENVLRQAKYKVMY